MALNPELKELRHISRSLSYFDPTGLEKAMLYLSGKGWVMKDAPGHTKAQLARSSWRFKNKGPWLSIATALKRQTDQDHIWSFNKEEIHELGLDLRRALENRWSFTEMHDLVNKLIALTEQEHA